MMMQCEIMLKQSKGIQGFRKVPEGKLSNLKFPSPWNTCNYARQDSVLLISISKWQFQCVQTNGKRFPLIVNEICRKDTVTGNLYPFTGQWRKSQRG